MAKNVDEWIVSKLDTIERLRDHVFPTAAPAGDLSGPFAIFRLSKEDVARDIDGSAGIRTAVFRIEFFDNDNDALCALVAEAEGVLCQGTGEDAEGIYVYFSRAERGDEDDCDQTLDMLVKNLTVTVSYWRD